MENKERIQKSLRLNSDLAERIENDAKKETRSFNTQLEHMIKKYYELKDNKKNNL